MRRELPVGMLAVALSLATLGCAEGTRSPGDGTTGPPREPWVVPAEEAEGENPVLADEAARAAGQQTFERKCATCHGPGGRGNGPSAVWLDTLPADLTAEGVQQQSDADLFWKISEGREPMPAFKESLTEHERWEVIHYVRGLAAGPEE